MPSANLIAKGVQIDPGIIAAMPRQLWPPEEPKWIMEVLEQSPWQAWLPKGYSGPRRCCRNDSGCQQGQLDHENITAVPLVALVAMAASGGEVTKAVIVNHNTATA
jgi:hypothetical protein